MGKMRSQAYLLKGCLDCTIIQQKMPSWVLNAALLEEMESLAEQLDGVVSSLQTAEARAETAENQTQSLQSQIMQLQVAFYLMIHFASD